MILHNLLYRISRIKNNFYQNNKNGEPIIDDCGKGGGIKNIESYMNNPKIQRESEKMQKVIEKYQKQNH